MPKFNLNENGGRYDDLSEFAKAYVEAMFFTNCDTGDDDDHKANRLGTSRLTRNAIAKIARDCDAFETANDITIARVLRRNGRDLEGIAHDFWFTRQGHGCGFWEGEARGYPDDIADVLYTYSKAQGEVYPYFSRGWIYL